MSKKINLTIREIVEDFEKLVRYDERLDSLFDHELANDDHIEKFHQDLVEMIEKYLPSYKDKINQRYFSDEASTYEKSIILYKPLYDNFKEIFYQLV